MACKKCGETNVSGLCKFCAREESRDGSWNPGTDTEDASDD